MMDIGNKEQISRFMDTDKNTSSASEENRF